MRHRIEHALGVVGARALLDKAFRRHAPSYASHKPRLSFVDDSHALVTLETSGYRLHIAVTLTATALEFVAQLPWSLRLFQGQVLRAVDRELRALIAEAQLRRANAHGC